MTEINGNVYEQYSINDSYKSFNGVVKYLLSRGVKEKTQLIKDYSTEMYSIKEPDLYDVCDEIQRNFKAFGRWVNDNRTKYI